VVNLMDALKKSLAADQKPKPKRTAAPSIAPDTPKAKKKQRA